MDCLDILCDVVQGRWCCLSRPLSYGFARMRAPCIIVVVGCVRVVCEEGRGVRENAQMERMDGGPILQDSHFLDPLLLWLSVVSHMEMLMSVRERMSSCSSPRGERERERALDVAVLTRLTFHVPHSRRHAAQEGSC